MTISKNTLLLDANSVFARSWYAAQKIGLDSSGALRLAAVTVLNILNPVAANSPGAIFGQTLFCWDGNANPAKGRKPKPPAFYETRNIAKDLFTLLLGAAHAEHEQYEGDDLIASAVSQASAGASLYIASGDKDLMQLIQPNVYYYSLHEKCLLTDSFVCNKFHVKHPQQIAVALAIQGDPVDRIAGVRGWGLAKVRSLFRRVNRNMTFDEVLAVMENAMNEDQRREFYTALERTMLTDTVNVPPPAPVIFAEDADADALGIPEISRCLKETRFALSQ